MARASAKGVFAPCARQFVVASDPVAARPALRAALLLPEVPPDRMRFPHSASQLFALHHD